MIIIIIIITFKAFKKINIMILMRIFKTFNEKFDDNDFINNDADLKFESSVNINLLKRNSQSL